MDSQPNNETAGPSSNTKLIAVAAILILAVLLVFGIRAFSGNDNTANTNSSATDSAARSTTTNDATSSNNAANGSYQDGTYSATGSYATPEGEEQITVKLTLADGTVTDTSATASGKARESRQYQSQFLNAYKELVVGKSVDELRLSRVSGSSLTSQGFNKAVQTIKQQAAIQG